MEVAKIVAHGRTRATRRGGWGARVFMLLFAPQCPPSALEKTRQFMVHSQLQWGALARQRASNTHAPPKPPGAWRPSPQALQFLLLPNSPACRYSSLFITPHETPFRQSIPVPFFLPQTSTREDCRSRRWARRRLIRTRRPDCQGPLHLVKYSTCPTPRSSSGPGHRPLTAETGVRLPYGVLGSSLLRPMQ